MDAEEKHAFGTGEEARALVEGIESLCRDRALTKALEIVVNELGKCDASVQIQD
jgi:hypothetical protein